MSQILVWVLFVAFLIRTIRNTLYQVFLWQLKEYRLDRFLVHLRTWQGKRLVFGPISLAKWILLLLFFLNLPIFLPVVAVYTFEAILNLRETVSSFKKPIFTFKATVVSGVVIIGEVLLFFWQPPLIGGLTFWVLILDKVLSPTVALLFVGLAIPTQIQRRKIIAKAKGIIRKHPKLLIIGITGSYGKTSTKEFLSSILSSKFKVLKTAGSNNTDIGIAKTIVENLSDQEIFVCEMAAYKRGEIKAICDIVHPQIGIITGINEQHLELFGTLENTIKTKHELIEALPKNGLAIFNGNNKYTRELAEKAKKSGLKVFEYSSGDFTARDIKVLPEKLEFEIQIGDEKQTLSTNLLGRQNVENILASVVVAHHLGMSLGEIGKRIGKLTPPEMTMKPYPGPASSTLIDDTFNANPAGVLVALEYAKIYKGKKILVIQPMIELGKATEEAHREVGRTSTEICDLVILTNKNFNQPFLTGAGKNKEKVLILDPKTAANKIKDMVDNKSVVIFEGKETARVLGHLT